MQESKKSTKFSKELKIQYYTDMCIALFEMIMVEIKSVDRDENKLIAMRKKRSFCETRLKALCSPDIQNWDSDLQKILNDKLNK